MNSAAARRRPQGLTASSEHYLRAILELREERGYARAVDIATRLGRTKGSVSLALTQLEERGLVRFDSAHFPLLTPAGRRMAVDLVGRYRIVHTFLIDLLGVGPDQANAEACRWEHVISHQVADRMLDLLRYCSEDAGMARSLRAFHQFHRNCVSGGSCATCAVHGPVQSFCAEPTESHE